MEVLTPLCITSRLLPGVRIGDAEISIEYCGPPTKEGRQHYHWYIDLPPPPEFDSMSFLPSSSRLSELEDNNEDLIIDINLPFFTFFQGICSIPERACLIPGKGSLQKALEFLLGFLKEITEGVSYNICKNCQEKELREGGIGALYGKPLPVSSNAKSFPGELADWAVQNAAVISVIEQALKDEPGGLIIE